MTGSNGVPTCKACGAPAVYFPADGDDRCLGCLRADTPALRSDGCPRCAQERARAEECNARLVEAERILTTWGGIGGDAALRALRGETP